MKTNFGMWLFIASEVLIFGALIMLFEINYSKFHLPFKLASKELHYYHGIINTFILLTSSYLVALSQAKKRRIYVLGAIFLGFCFLMVKGHEYYGLIEEKKFVFNFLETIPIHQKLFFTFYGFLTMLHALHVILGILVLIIVWWQMEKEIDPEFQENVGLYWHFVDLVWVYLFPLFYLLGH
ncbi:MAG: cytochrome c oxidase subunit 3 [Bacteriovoracaceae bacterium]